MVRRFDVEAPGSGFVSCKRMIAAVPKPGPSVLDQSVSALPGVGRERAIQLARLEIRTVDDLLLHRPRRYEDRRHLRSISQLQLQEAGITRGRIVAQGVKWFKQHTKSVFEIVLDDGTARLHCRWWNLPYMENYFAPGDEVLVFGKLGSLKPRAIDHPETEVIEAGEESFIHLNRLTPIYPLTEGIAQRWLRALIWRTLGAHESEIHERSFSDIPAQFLSRAQAIRGLHFPETEAEAVAARRRLALDEFLELQVHIQRRRRNFETKSQGLICRGDNRLIKPFLARVGFKLTAAQTRVLRELRQDLAGAHPMRRLLQGDVGSGKTVVAACCALMVLESRYEVAIMVPTEILAEQHFLTFSKWWEPLGIRVELQTGSHKTAPGGQGMPAIAAAPTPLPKLTIGTHALIESGFSPDNLGLVIIDEQHKFGVAQREQLVRKGRYPHLLVMTATPIPRTLGLTLYGELDVSTIDELPAGRARLRTFIRTSDKLPKVWAFLKSQLAAGRQAYVVYPRVEEGATEGLKAVNLEYENVRKALSPFRVGLVHGRIRPRDKESVMAAFRAKELEVLLSTSLIEVGVDVPNATVMLIENAERFGLAQLHQLRGRIGRGANESFCILVAAARKQEARERLRILEETTDGFRISEADLKLRGPGELLGQLQSGLPNFRFGDLSADLDLLELARKLVSQLQTLAQKSQ